MKIRKEDIKIKFRLILF